MRLRVTANNVVFDVIDEGDDIDAETLARISQPFRRGSNGVPSTGLGLYVSRRIVERPDGRLLIESTLGKSAHSHSNYRAETWFATLRTTLLEGFVRTATWRGWRGRVSPRST